MPYEYLMQKIQERGIRKSVIANALHISPRALYNKLTGKSPFSWEQACLLQNKFFPDINKDELLERKQ